MRIEDLLLDLGRQIGLSLQLDANRTCRLVFDSRWTVDIEAPADRRGVIFLYSSLGMLPTQNREAFFHLLLEANLFGRGTGDATLAIDGTANDALAFRALSEDTTDYQGFVKAIEDFVRTISVWTERLASFDHVAPAQGVERDFDPLAMVRI